jgi:LuxR family maltose regulon positive regulatory protein
VAESPAATEADAAAAQRDVLLATKLHLPGLRPGLVARPRLAGQLDAGLDTGLVLVCAPAGYGKTILLADWARRGRQPAAWLSLDAADNDPARFWRHAVAALNQLCPGISDRLAPLLGSPAQSLENLVTALVNELAARPGSERLLLILDDYQVIRSQPVHESVSFLLASRPPQLQVVLASRSDPPLPLARLRARGQLAELRAAELRFTPGEAAELLQQAAVAVRDTDVAALAARTEGWAAGLQLAALSLRGHADVAGFVAAFTGSNRYVLDYLAEEVLERQSDQVRAFLLETSALGRLSGSLCDAVTGRPGSQELLEQVEAAGLFLVPLDDVRGWWRYHHLFADLLRARLEQQPGVAARLHRNAAAWYEGHGLADDAIGHAAAAGDAAWAARLIEQHFDMVYYLGGEAATIQRWLALLPAELIRSRPRLLLAQAQMAAASGRVAEAERAADAAEQAAAGEAEEPFEPTVGRSASMLINVPGQVALERSYLAQLRGDAAAAADFAEQVLARSDAGEWLLTSTARGFLAVSEWLRGRLTEAEQAFRSSIDGLVAAGQVTVAAWGCYQLSQVEQALGNLDAAAAANQRALDSTVPASGPPPPAAGPAYVGLAEVAYQRNDLDAALRQVTEGIALSRQFVYTPPLAAGLVTLAWIRQASGDPAGAREAIEEAMRAAPEPPGLLNPVPAQRARLLLAQGDAAAAASWTGENGLGAGDEPDYARESGHLVLARVLLAQGRPADALALLDRLHAAALAGGRTASVIEAGALRALALAASDEDAAAAVLAGVLALACPQGYVRVFADAGPPMAALVGRQVAAQRSGRAVTTVAPGCLARLQSAFSAAPGQPGSPPRSGSAPGLVDPLTSREQEVLELLAAGSSNRAIAAELVVTIDTVKKHVSHVLDKLGAASRTEAVACARALGLIP